uniref:6-cysteine protein n=1 Tax=Strongyloides papillosus TaxID=174720 RepID=A0A0N5CAV7_STREA
MGKMLKLLWILAVFSIYKNSCQRPDRFKRQFKYYSENETYDGIFPRNQTVMSDTNTIALKCPLSHSAKRRKPGTDERSHIAIYENFDDNENNINIPKTDDDIYVWKFVSIEKNQKMKKINCLNIYINNISNLIAEWSHLIRRTDGQKLNIKRKKDLNIILHSHEKNIYSFGVSEITFVSSVLWGYRNFDSRQTFLFKGEILVTFNADKINSEDIEFQEPIGITQVYHPPPFIDIQNDPRIKVNAKNKEWWFVEPHSFPWTFTIKLVYNSTTNQPGFFNNENITVSYLRYSKDNKLREIKKDILKPNNPNTRNILLNESAIIKLNYFCDNCIEGGIDIVQNMIIGKNFDFENTVLPSVEYVYDKLNSEANCPMNLNNFTQLKTVSFNNEMIEVQALYGTNDEAKGNFSLSNGVVKFKNTNPSGTLKCTYIYPAGEFHTSQTYKSFKDEEMPSITYVYDKLFFKPNCSMSQGKSVTLKTVLFNNEKVEVKNFQASGNQMGNFKLNRTFVLFTDTNPKGILSCVYKLFNGEYSITQTYEHFKTTILPDVKYASNQLSFKANCSVELKTNAILKTISLEGNYVTYMDKNPVGKCVCVYKLSFGDISISQNYESFTDENMPLTTYRHDELHFKPNCSLKLNNFSILKTVSFNNEKIEAAKLQGTGGNQEGNFKKDNKFVVFTGTNPNGALSCTYQLPYGEFSKYQKYKSFKDQNIPPFTYLRGGLRLTPNCPMDQGDSVNLKTVSFDEERVEVSDLNSRSDKRKGNFKSDGKFVNFLGTNPKGKLSCVFKLSYGEVSTNQSYGYFSNINHPIIRYASDQLVIRPNCSMEPEKNVNLETILFNDESVEADYLQNTGNNPKGKCTCVYKLQVGEIKTFQEYQSIEDTTLPDVKYAYDQLNFNPNCSREENTYTQLKTIKLNDKTIEVEGLNDAELIQMGNLKPTKDLLLYTVQNPEGKFSCIYKVPIGEIKKSQNYNPISNETHPVVEYSYNDLGYNANCSRHLNSFTHLRGIQFKDDKTTVVSLQRSRVGALGRLKLEKDFVINTEKNPNGTLRCLYDVPIGEVWVIKNFTTFKTGDEENSSKKMGYVASIILGYMIVISMMI